MKLKSKRSKACDISQKTKEIVFERDNHKCILCGSRYGQPNAHFIARSKGGLGIEQNIVTLCFRCHQNYDFGDYEQHHNIQNYIREYLKSKYENWNEEDLLYKK